MSKTESEKIARSIDAINDRIKSLNIRIATLKAREYELEGGSNAGK